MASITRRNETLINSNFFVVVVVAMTIVWSFAVVATDVSTPPTTNPADLRALHELMSAMYYEYDWATNVPDPCVSSPQGIVCEADPITGILYVTQLQFGYISPLANIIPCSFNATIPNTTLSSFTRLTSLTFRSCFTNLTTTLPISLPSLGSSIRFLSFTRNPSLTGSIPVGLSNLTNLERLVLSQNSLTGSIPSDLTTLSVLSQLDLSHNEMSGSLLPELGAMSSLVNLDLRFNKFSGVFPSELARGGPRLQRLAMSYNNLSGSLPDSFEGLKLLTFLDLSSNFFSGSIPVSIGSLPVLEDLFLNVNRFDGVVPESLTNLTRLVRLDLSSCAFIGEIPDSFHRLGRLRFFSVSRNRLSGGIPGSLASLPVIFTLGLDGNRLSGPVPFPRRFVERMGRNLQLAENAALCSSPELKLLLPNLEQCPESALRPAAATNLSPPSVLPNAATVTRASPISLLLARILITALITTWTFYSEFSWHFSAILSSSS